MTEQVGGPGLAAWLVLASAVSNICLYEAEMSGDAYLLMGMADRGLVPKFFCKQSRFGTPSHGILVGTLVVNCLGVANFDQVGKLTLDHFVISCVGCRKSMHSS